jgi:hypothetical protein
MAHGLVCVPAQFLNLVLCLFSALRPVGCADALGFSAFAAFYRRSSERVLLLVRVDSLYCHLVVLPSVLVAMFQCLYLTVSLLIG